jgi:hypothetical protein
MSTTRIAIVGAGPIGLDAALAAAEAGFDFTLYEATSAPGGHVRSWGHVRLFTPWSMNVSPRARSALAAAGIEVPTGEECPTGRELAERLLAPVASLEQIAPHIEYGARILEIGRDGLLKTDEIGTGARADVPFRLLIQDADGGERVAYADAVLDCSGTYGTPNAMGVGGIQAPGERSVADRVIHRIPDLDVDDFQGAVAGLAGYRILLVGAGHSAQTAARDLARLIQRAPGTSVVWAIRRQEPDFGSVEDDPLPARAELVKTASALAGSRESPLDVRLGTVVEALAPSKDGIVATLRGPGGETDSVVVDRIISLTGSVGDARMYRQLQVHECWATAGPMKLAAALLSSSSDDCLAETSHGVDSLVNPEPNFFVLGEKSYGRNTNFLMRVGWQQVDEVISYLGAVSQATAVVR